VKPFVVWHGSWLGGPGMPTAWLGEMSQNVKHAIHLINAASSTGPPRAFLLTKRDGRGCIAVAAVSCLDDIMTAVEAEVHAVLAPPTIAPTAAAPADEEAAKTAEAADYAQQTAKFQALTASGHRRDDGKGMVHTSVKVPLRGKLLSGSERTFGELGLCLAARTLLNGYVIGQLRELGSHGAVTCHLMTLALKWAIMTFALPPAGRQAWLSTRPALKPNTVLAPTSPAGAVAGPLSIQSMSPVQFKAFTVCVFQVRATHPRHGMAWRKSFTRWFSVA
jgi:hypothetical protein